MAGLILDIIHPAASAAAIRMARRDNLQMPPIGTSRIDHDGLLLMLNWMESLQINRETARQHILGQLYLDGIKPLGGDYNKDGMLDIGDVLLAPDDLTSP